MIILHVDMDAFFAAIEQRDHPEWRGKPVIVGAGPHERGVVSTCSYEARKYGVRSAMPSRTAFAKCPHGIFVPFAKCPHGIFVPPRMHVYQEVSDVAFEVFARFSPFVEGVSVDEAFLDVTGTAHLFGGMKPLAEKLRAEIQAACGVTCSVGLAPNRLLAKIASEQNKPNGLFVMPFDSEGIRAFLAPKPIKILWGVGGKTAELLERYGYRTCADLQNADPRFLTRLLGDAAAESIRNHAFGIDDSGVAHEPAEERPRRNPFRASTPSPKTSATARPSGRRCSNWWRTSGGASAARNAGRARPRSSCATDSSTRSRVRPRSRVRHAMTSRSATSCSNSSTANGRPAHGEPSAW